MAANIECRKEHRVAELIRMSAKNMYAMVGLVRWMEPMCGSFVHSFSRYLHSLVRSLVRSRETRRGTIQYNLERKCELECNHIGYRYVFICEFVYVSIYPRGSNAMTGTVQTKRIPVGKIIATGGWLWGET